MNLESLSECSIKFAELEVSEADGNYSTYVHRYIIFDRYKCMFELLYDEVELEDKENYWHINCKCVIIISISWMRDHALSSKLYIYSFIHSYHDSVFSSIITYWLHICSSIDATSYPKCNLSAIFIYLSNEFWIHFLLSYLLLFIRD